MPKALEIYVIRWIYKESGEFAGRSFHTTPIAAQACFMAQDNQKSKIRPDVRNEDIVQADLLTSQSELLRKHFKDNNGTIYVQAGESSNIAARIATIYKRDQGTTNMKKIHLPRNRVLKEQPVNVHAETPANHRQTSSGRHHPKPAP